MLLALVLRLWAIGWQLPSLLYSDELKYVLVPSTTDPELESEVVDFRNPSLFRHLINLEHRLFLLGQPALGGGDLGPKRLLLARITVALLGAGSVVLLYVLGRHVLGRRGGVLAAALLAVNFLHVQLSHLSVNDVPACFLMIMALIPSVALLERPNRRGFLLAGFLGGLAAATKYNFGIVLVVPLATWALLVKRRAATRELLLDGLALLGFSAVVGFLVGMPEALLSPAAVREGIVQQARLGDRRWSGQALDPAILLYGKTLLQAFGAPALLAALAGLGLLTFPGPGSGPVTHRRWAMLVLAACPLIYLAYMASKVLFFARFALLLVPFACLFAAHGLLRLWAKVRTPHGRTALVAAVCLATLGPPLVLSARLDLLAQQVDTRVEAKHWVLANVSPGSKLAVQNPSVPYALEADDLGAVYDLTVFTLFGDQRRFVQIACAGNRHVLLSSFRWEREPTVGRPGEPTGYELLAQRGRLLATFWPGPNETSVPLNIDDVGLPFWQVMRYARPGPTVAVYELPAEAC